MIEVHVVPSGEVRMVTLEPTTTCDGLEVVVLLSPLLFLAQEMTVRLKNGYENYV